MGTPARGGMTIDFHNHIGLLGNPDEIGPLLNQMLTELKKSPATLRLSYVADVEPESLVEKRLDALKDTIMQTWEDQGCCYELVVEPEIFWRRGGPPDTPREVPE